MDCSAFHRHHVGFVDDTLPGDLLVAAVRHAAECPACARHDTAVRRSLMVARSMAGGDVLECSPDFAARLEARLLAARADAAAGRTVGARASGLPDDWAPRWWELAATQVSEHLSAHRRTRQALAAAAMLAAVSTGALLRGGARPTQFEGLGGGVLTAAPFGSPFASVATDALGESSGGVAGFGPAAVAEYGSAGAQAGLGGATYVGYDGAADAGDLVAPAAVGVPVWAAAMLAGEVPAALWRNESAPSVELVRVGH